MTALSGVAGGCALVVTSLLMLRGSDTAVGGYGAAGTRATVGDAVQVAATTPPQGLPSAAGFVPDRLVIPRLSVDAAVVPVVVDAGGSLGVPDDPAVLGWWRDGARPGAATGSVVIDGHVDSARSGPGVLFHLQTLVPGDVVTVSGQGRSARYVVAARRQYSKATLPASVFDQEVAGRLVLITCGGSFDRRSRHYADNVVVFARPA